MSIWDKSRICNLFGNSLIKENSTKFEYMLTCCTHSHHYFTVCDICGDMRAEVICRQCDSKQLCRGCHIKWHKHPKRQNHQIELIRPSTSAETTPQSNFNVGFKEKQVPSISQSGMVAATRGTLAVQGTIQQQQQQQEYQLHDQQGSRPAFSFQPFTQMPSFQHYGKL